MPTFAELVAKASEGPEAIGEISEYVTALQAAHEEELTREVTVRQTVINDLESAAEKREEEMTSLMRTNYGLIMGKSDGKPAGDEPPAPVVTGTDSLFKSKES